MKITICGSMKFNDKMLELKNKLEVKGHQIHMPIAVGGLDYWDEDNTKRIEAKKGLRLIETHFDKIIYFLIFLAQL